MKQEDFMTGTVSTGVFKGTDGIVQSLNRPLDWYKIFSSTVQK